MPVLAPSSVINAVPRKKGGEWQNRAYHDIVLWMPQMHGPIHSHTYMYRCHTWFFKWWTANTPFYFKVFFFWSTSYAQVSLFNTCSSQRNCLPGCGFDFIKFFGLTSEAVKGNCCNPTWKVRSAFWLKDREEKRSGDWGGEKWREQFRTEHWGREAEERFGERLWVDCQESDGDNGCPQRESHNCRGKNL